MKVNKGIILAGGTGRRLGPTTLAVNKQLLMLYDKPLIFYPLYVLMQANIKDILIIINPNQKNNFKNILGNGSHLGIKIHYIIQKKPSGIPEAFKIGKKFINNSNVCLILGDNFFFHKKLDYKINSSTKFKGCKIFIKSISEPEKYGVVKIKNKEILNIIEKPKKFVSNFAITGLYFFDKNVVKLSYKLKPSKRGETEITDLIKIYRKKNKLDFSILSNNVIWSDVGTINDFNKISNFIKKNKKKSQIGCLEEIAFKKKWINKKQIYKNIKFYGNCQYSEYLKKI